MNKPKIYLCLPILNEADRLPALLENIALQSYKNIELIACVNQPEEWWNLDDKRDQCLNNQKSLEILKRESPFPITIIDKSSRGKAWTGKQKGVGWARKLAMDKAAKSGKNNDLMVSIDADTTYPSEYLNSLVQLFNSKKTTVGLANPYYHPLSSHEAQNYAILRYEIYMRNYAINMLLIDNPYHFTALGSAMATTLKVYKKVGGLSPKASGEDFYFLQKLSKYGELIHWNSIKVLPAARFSNRVNFGTGPAMLKGHQGDWSSYPIYPHSLFQKVRQTYEAFPSLFEKEIRTPMSSFLQQQLKRDEIWLALRKNYKSQEQFIKACQTLVDGLRILQFLKSETTFKEKEQSQILSSNLVYFSKIDSEYTKQLKELSSHVKLNEMDSLIALRETLTDFEYSLRKLKSKD
jgi:glycosyltransferase involved in cell wall biosynthesis